MADNGAIPLAEGKTKIIYPYQGTHVLVVSKDDLTAGDGKKHDVIPGKGEWATETTVNVFELLKRHGLPLAYVKRHGSRGFIAEQCRMFPFEVVARRYAYGSILKRYPSLTKGARLESLIVEFYLKTSGREFEGVKLPCDDPIVVEWKNRTIIVADPALSTHEVRVGSDKKIPVTFNVVGPMSYGLNTFFAVTRRNMELLFPVLEDAWKKQEIRLADIKVEFGLTSTDDVVIADVIDNDSWRIVDTDGVHLDKQLYREGAPLEKVAKAYQEVARLTARFWEDETPF